MTYKNSSNTIAFSHAAKYDHMLLNLTVPANCAFPDTAQIFSSFNCHCCWNAVNCCHLLSVQQRNSVSHSPRSHAYTSEMDKQVTWVQLQYREACDLSIYCWLASACTAGVAGAFPPPPCPACPRFLTAMFPVQSQTR